MNKLNLLALPFIMVGLTGCSGTMSQLPPKDEYKVIPRHLLANCHVTKPPVTVAQYKAMTADKREEVLSKYSNSLLGDLDTCNIRMGEVRKANDDLDKLLNGPENSSKVK